MITLTYKDMFISYIVQYKALNIMVPISDIIVVKNIIFRKNEWYLLKNSNDLIIIIYENLIPLKIKVRVLDKLNEKQYKLEKHWKVESYGIKMFYFIP